MFLPFHLYCNSVRFANKKGKLLFIFAVCQSNGYMFQFLFCIFSYILMFFIFVIKESMLSFIFSGSVNHNLIWAISFSENKSLSISSFVFSENVRHSLTWSVSLSVSITEFNAPLFWIISPLPIKKSTVTSKKSAMVFSAFRAEVTLLLYNMQLMLNTSEFYTSILINCEF